MKDIITYIHESGTADMHALAKEYETADGSRKDTLLARLVHEAKSHAGRYADADSGDGVMHADINDMFYVTEFVIWLADTKHIAKYIHPDRKNWGIPGPDIKFYNGAPLWNNIKPDKDTTASQYYMAIELIGKVDTFCKKNGYDTAELVKKLLEMIKGK